MIDIGQRLKQAGDVASYKMWLQTSSEGGGTVKVSLFVTCLADGLFPEVAESAVRVLQRYGVEVAFPMQQTCCGQPAFNSGYWDEAREVASNWLAAFADSDYIVSPSGSCAGMAAHYYPELFKDDPTRRALAERLVARTYEFTQFLVDVLRVNHVDGYLDAHLTYHPSCHAMRLLGVTEPPKQLLQLIPGLKLTELPYAEQCCGFGGTFAVKMGDVSTAMVSEKVDHVVETGAAVLVGTDLGCLMNIGGRMRRLGKNIGVLHIAQVIDLAQRRVPIGATAARGLEVAE